MSGATATKRYGDFKDGKQILKKKKKTFVNSKTRSK